MYWYCSHKHAILSVRAKEQIAHAEKEKREAERRAEFEALPEWKKKLIAKQRHS